MNLFYKIKYLGGSVYHGLVGMKDNVFDKAPEVKTGVEWFVLGISVAGRNIRCYKIGNGPKKILFVAGIHGNEVGTVKLAQNLINWIFVKREIFFNLTIFVVPSLNPDGAEVARQFPDYFGRGRFGRFNGNDVDLDRNFPSENWQSKSIWPRGSDYGDEAIEVSGGEAPGSEVEVGALINLIENENIKDVISFHNVAGDVIVNLENPVAMKWANIYHAKAKFRIVKSPRLSGNMSEFCRENNINFMTVEGTRRWGSDWKRQKKALEALLEEVGSRE
jgi:predicted deacylase